MFTEALFVIAKGGNNPNGHRLMNGQTKHGLSIQWKIIQPQKQATTWLNLENIMLSKRSQAQKAIYMKCPEKANPQTERAD